MDTESHEFYKNLKERLTRETGLGTEYSISPSDFESLLTEPRVVSLLKEWFDLSILTKDKRNILLHTNGEEIGITQVYMDIELDPKKRFDIYQIGMSIWR